LDIVGSGQGPVAGCCECGDKPSGSGATELVSFIITSACKMYVIVIMVYGFHNSYKGYISLRLRAGPTRVAGPRYHGAIDLFPCGSPASRLCSGRSGENGSTFYDAVKQRHVQGLLCKQ
jgi:hypothetical protein